MKKYIFGLLVLVSSSHAAQIVPGPYLVTLYVGTQEVNFGSGTGTILKSYHGLGEVGGLAYLAALKACNDDGNTASQCSNAWSVNYNPAVSGDLRQVGK